MTASHTPPSRILVIRRDNIGDLVCTTPLFSALRRHFPQARIEALVNSYNAPVLHGNPAIDALHAYRKAKHRAPGESKLSIWWQTARLMHRLRKENFDVVILATPAQQTTALDFARWIRPRRIIAYGTRAEGIDAPIPLAEANIGHETEAVMRLLRPFGLEEAPGPVHVHPHAAAAISAGCSAPPTGGAGWPTIGLHISSRKPSQRWPAEKFAELAKRLFARHKARFLLFWSPGSEAHPLHPGDDEKAQRLIASCRDIPLFPMPTHRLDELISGLAHCDRIICSDGGAMHLAAGLGKPIVCFFGDSNPKRWHPWGVPHELLQPISREVAEISVDEALAAYERLTAHLDKRTDCKQNIRVASRGDT